ncbi:hypothetical protein KIPB_005696 [Kipferlia bialata]|uniref:Uncharacterized protein n=1 Tax=Kipferlia bialata TaxID=797122 RepID=A0A391NWD9_9EUKA|nr:hypothetical protein KIPB_005696 [Kipferlia bialata]|eukprot:g5696.t1
MITLDTLSCITWEGSRHLPFPFSECCAFWHFTLDGQGFLVDDAFSNEDGCHMWHLGEDRNTWVESEFLAPVLVCDPCVIGLRAYGVNTQGHIVSFDIASGWSAPKGSMPLWGHPMPVIEVDSMCVGHFLLITHQIETEDRFRVWRVYDTISGELGTLPILSPGLWYGMYSPALCVLDVPYMGTGNLGLAQGPYVTQGIAYSVNPALAYPDIEMEWGILPCGLLNLPESQD